MNEVWLVICNVKECPIHDVPSGFPNEPEAKEYRKLHAKNHSNNSQAVKVAKLEDWIK